MRQAGQSMEARNFVETQDLKYPARGKVERRPMGRKVDRVKGVRLRYTAVGARRVAEHQEGTSSSLRPLASRESCDENAMGALDVWTYIRGNVVVVLAWHKR